MKLQRQKYKLARRSLGQGIVESAVALILIAMVLVGGIVLLCDAGTYIIYKIKLASIADSAAQYAADETYWLGARRPMAYFSASQIQGLTDKVVQNLLMAQGMFYMPAVNAPVTSDPTGTVCTVTVTADNLPLPFSLGILPASISDTEVGATPYPNDFPVAVMKLLFVNASGTQQGIILPTYGIFAPSTTVPAPLITNVFAGTPPNSGTNNPYPGSKFPYWSTTVYQSGPGGP